MTKTLLQNIEQVIERQSNDVYLTQLLRQYGLPLVALKQTQNEYSNVYGTDAGTTETTEHEFVGIVVGDDFFSSDGLSYGAFQEGFLYTDSEIPKPGDTLKIERPGLQIRKYKITDLPAVGTSRSVFKRYKLSALG